MNLKTMADRTERRESTCSQIGMRPKPAMMRYVVTMVASVLVLIFLPACTSTKPTVMQPSTLPANSCKIRLTRANITGWAVNLRIVDEGHAYDGGRLATRTNFEWQCEDDPIPTIKKNIVNLPLAPDPPTKKRPPDIGIYDSGRVFFGPGTIFTINGSEVGLLGSSGDLEWVRKAGPYRLSAIFTGIVRIGFSSKTYQLKPGYQYHFLIDLNRFGFVFKLLSSERL